jgi:hypothetical protein
MDLQWADGSRKTIIVTLDEGEAIGSLVGPTQAFVPNDPLNEDYAAIVASGFTINAEASS